MKKFMPFVLSGFIGSVIALGGAAIFFQPGNPPSSVNVSPVGRFTSNIPGGLPDLAEAAAKSIPSVVHIYSAETQRNAQSTKKQVPKSPFDDFWGGGGFWGLTFEEPLKQGTGSGVILTEDGYIVTNNHVVEFADDIQVTLSDNRKYKAKIIGTDPKTDLAVIKIEGNNLPAISKGDSDDIRVGDWVLAIGNPAIGYNMDGSPQELNSTVTAGIISAKGRDIGIIDGKEALESFIQTDAVVNPGNSGGALVDQQGQLIGINTAIATTNGHYQGYSFAIPVSLMQKVVDDIIEFGSYSRPYLGVEISEMDEDRAKELGVDNIQGVFIENVVNGGSAQYAGLLPRDIIVQVNDRNITTIPQLQEIVSRSKPGDTLVLSVIRNGKNEKIPVTLKAG
jgi:serine protease Do